MNEQTRNITFVRTSIVSGKQRRRIFPVYDRLYQRYKAGELKVQHAFPNLTDDEREFIMTGITQKEWDETFPEEDES